ncbi:hypothetical protein [Oleidesulfovibrio alaskensis]
MFDTAKRTPIDRCFALLPENDLESHHVVKLAERIKLKHKAVKCAWGLNAEEELRCLRHALLKKEYADNAGAAACEVHFAGCSIAEYDLPETVTEIILVEMPCATEEARLREMGYIVTVIDHHVYGDDDRSAAGKGSALDQILDRFYFEIECLNLRDDEKETFAHVSMLDAQGPLALAFKTELTYGEIEKLAIEDWQYQTQGREIDLGAIIDEAKNTIPVSLLQARKTQFPHYHAGVDNELKKYEGNIVLICTKHDVTGPFAFYHQLPSEQILNQLREKYNRSEVKERVFCQSVIIITAEPNEFTDGESAVHANVSAWKNALEVNVYADIRLRDTVLSCIPMPQNDYIIWSGGTGDGVSFYWGGRNKDKDTDKPKSCNKLVDSLLNCVVGFNRPMQNYVANFVAPFKISASPMPATNSKWMLVEDDESFGDRVAYAAEKLYFYPYIRDVLYNVSQKKEAVGRGKQNKGKIRQALSGVVNIAKKLLPRCEKKVAAEDLPNDCFALRTYTYETGDDASLKLCFYTGNNVEKAVSFPVNRIFCQVYPGNILLLCIQFERSTNVKVEQGDFWQYCLQLDRFRNEQLTLGQAMLFSESGRRMYPVFKDQIVDYGDPEKESYQHFPHKWVLSAGGEVFEPSHFSTVVADECLSQNDALAKLIAPLFGNTLKEKKIHEVVRQVLDDRMLVHVFYDMVGSMPNGDAARSSFEAQRFRMLYVDAVGDGYAYDERFLNSNGRDGIYERWESLGTFMGFTRYSSITQSFTAPDYLLENHKRMYLSIFLLSVYYRAFLVDMSARVAKYTEEIRSVGGLDKFIALKQEFMIFANKYWFIEFTSQEQGIEMFALQKKVFDFEPLYQQVKEEIARAEAYLELQEQKQNEVFQDKLTFFGGIVAFLGLLFAFMGMNVDAFGYTSTLPYIKNNYVFGGLVFSFVTSLLVAAIYLCRKKNFVHATARANLKFKYTAWIIGLNFFALAGVCVFQWFG